MKKLLSFAIAAMLGASAWAFSGGDGTAANPYQVKTAADLNEFATAVTGGTTYAGQYVSLENDLTLSGTFTPIGAASLGFDGTFDGKGHTISGLTINGEKNQGLFGYVTVNGVVKNIKLASPTLTSSGTYAGFIAGQLDGKVDSCYVTGATFNTGTNMGKGGIVGFAKAGSNIEHCSFSGSISAAVACGGIVGQGYGNVRHCWSDATIVSIYGNVTTIHMGGIVGNMLKLGGDAPVMEDCYFIGSIAGATGNNVGGLAGTFRDATMQRCWNGGYLSSTGYCGGLAATLYTSDIIDCYNVGTIYDVNSQYVGGIGGYCSSTSTSAGGARLTNVLSLGTVFNSVLARGEGCEFYGSSSSTGTPVLTNCYFDAQVAGWGSVTGSKTTKELTTGTALDGFSSDVWVFSAGMYPRLKNSATHEMAILDATPFYLADGESHGSVKSDFTVSSLNDVEWELSGGGSNAVLSGTNVKVTRGQSAVEVILHSYLGDYEKRSLVTISPDVFEGKGTADDPYLIKTYDDLKRLSASTNDQGLTFTGEYFKLANDIDMENDATFTPIGSTSANAFSGVFDGDGHSIKNFKVSNVEAKTLNTGLFAYTSQYATIKNLVIDSSCDFTKVYRNFAPICAWNYGTIENCRNHAKVVSSNGYVAGIAYINYGSIIDCYNDGTITTTAATGGMGGITNSNYLTISGCLNAGSVIADFDAATVVAGIAGSNRGEISDVINTGNIIGGKCVGGIIGTSSTTSAKLTNALSLGVVANRADASLLGAVTGTSTACVYSNVGYDQQIVMCKNFSNTEIKGYNTADLVKDGFGGDKWSHAEGMYPTLAKFADEAGAKLGAAPLTLAVGDTRNQMSGDGALASVDGLTWTVKMGKYFTVDGNTLKMVATQDYQADTLTATLNGISKVIPIATIGNLLPGRGTADDPWIIDEADDFVTMGDGVEITGLDYAGKYFSVVKDIDMTGTSLAPIGGGTKKFSGIINGNGHKITNLDVTAADATNVGLIGHLGAEGAIYNLTIESGKVSGAQYVGSFVGLCDGVLKNLTNKASVTSTKGFTGGITGSATSTAQLDSLYNYGAVTGAAKTAGIVGNLVGSGSNTSRALYNEGTVSGTAYNAGIAAYAEAISLEDCENRGDVTGTSSEDGGIAGYVVGVPSVKNCRNYGAVQGSSDVGGVIGYAYKKYSYSFEIQVENCLNAGAVVTTSAHAGGILGRGTAPVINSCANFGDVTNTKANLSATTGGAAGIICTAVPKLTDCYNAGTITAANNVAGLLGYPVNTTGAIAFTNCVSVGRVMGYADASANVGAVMGKTSAKLTCTGVTYDKQMAPIAAVALADYEGVSATATADLLGVAPSENWTATASRYAVPTSVAGNQVAGLYTLPVMLANDEAADSVATKFEVATSSAYIWGADSVFTINSGKVSIAPAVGTCGLKVTDGTYVRTILLDVNCPEGSSWGAATNGDVNGDGKVDTTDLSALITIILNNGSAAENPAADVNGDGKIDTTDISALMAIILGA